MTGDSGSGKLIDIGKHIRGPVTSRFYNLIEQPFEKILSLDKLNRIYSEISSLTACTDAFFADCITCMNVSLDLTGGEIERIPDSGPLIVIGNHPFGALDGVILGALLTRRRDDVKLLGNYFLHRIPEIRKYIIPVDPFQQKKSTSFNITPLKEAIAWLRSDGALGVFPAGEVSHFQLTSRRVTDPQWSTHVASLVRRVKATVLPVYFDGQNSSLFQLMGLLHPRFRTIMLPRELIKKKHTSIKVRIGNPIPFRSLNHFETDRAMTEYLRLHTYFLGRRGRQPRLPDIGKKISFFRKTGNEPTIDPVAGDLLEREVGELDERNLLLRNGDFSVYFARSHEIPNILLEIGRLREITFREVGEGTGKACDIDRFDRYYLHLFMWDQSRRAVAGAYRLGATDHILSRYGKQGLYISTLFRLKRSFPANLGPALELGRSFICSHYQKKYNSLSILWRGIGEYVARNPQYKVLFGPVSISNDYQSMSKDMMIQFLRDSRRDPDLARYVQARHPARNRKIRELHKNDELTVEHVSALISGIEQDGKGVPVLLRHYLKLNGTILSFNLDKAFSRVIDSLLVVDLRKTDERLLKRFMGQDGYHRFRQHDGSASQPDLSEDTQPRISAETASA